MATVTSIGALTVNAAFLEEVKEVHQELWSLLASMRQRLSRPWPIKASRELVDDANRLRDLLALQFSLEEAYGYFAEPVLVAPRLSQRAHELRDQHRELYSRSCQMAEMGEALWERGARTSALLSRLAGAFQPLDELLQTHEAGERDLIMSAYNEDLGVGD